MPTLVLVSCLSVLLFGGCKTSTPSRQEDGLDVDPPRLDIGIVESGKAATGQFRVRNETNSSIEINQVEVSCPCVHLIIATPLRVDRDRDAVIAFDFDSRGEPDFRGKLDVQVRGMDSSGRVVLKAAVVVEVR